MGTICVNADFETQARLMKKYNKWNVTQAQIQSYYFNNFMRTNLLNVETEQLGYIKGEGMAVTFQAEIEPKFELFPNYVTYATYFSSSRWPVLNFAIESYMRERYISPQTKAQRGRNGLTSEEEINLELKERSLAEMMEDSSLDASIVRGALLAKGRMLLAQIEASSFDSDFGYWLTDFVKRNRFRTVSQQDLIDFLSVYLDVNLTDIIDPWYSASQIPGIILGDVESYDVIDREKTWTQVNFRVANPTSIDGIIRIDLRYRSDKNAGSSGRSDYSKVLFLPAVTTINVGISVDLPPALMTIDTFVSQNIPSVFNVPFLGQQPQGEGKPFDAEMAKPFDFLDFVSSEEYIVDNEDEGFQLLSTAKQSWLSRTLKNLFGTSEKESLYTGMNVYSPPSFWTLSASQEFYGQIVRSAYLKKAGEGENKVVWNVDLKEEGSYDIFFYNGVPPGVKKEMLMRAAAQNLGKSNLTVGARGRWNRGPGKRFFLIYFQYGMEEIVFDLENAASGWNLIGSFQLDAGPNKIEQTDKNDAGYVVADAVKWVKR
jgi:hypothetical protein